MRRDRGMPRSKQAACQGVMSLGGTRSITRRRGRNRCRRGGAGLDAVVGFDAMAELFRVAVVLGVVALAIVASLDAVTESAPLADVFERGAGAGPRGAWSRAPSQNALAPPQSGTRPARRTVGRSAASARGSPRSGRPTALVGCTGLFGGSGRCWRSDLGAGLTSARRQLHLPADDNYISPSLEA
jgi:hypothetical protein